MKRTLNAEYLLFTDIQSGWDMIIGQIPGNRQQYEKWNLSQMTVEDRVALSGLSTHIVHLVLGCQGGRMRLSAKLGIQNCAIFTERYKLMLISYIQDT